MDFPALEERLGYTFVQHTLLEQAVTHRSHGAIHNERLEFLGDAVLNCAIAQILFQKYGRLDEGTCPACAPTSSSRARWPRSPSGSFFPNSCAWAKAR